MALAGLDKVLGKRKNQQALMQALEKQFQANPVQFFKTVIMPLLPKESKLAIEPDGVIQWKSLLGGEVSRGVAEDAEGVAKVSSDQ